MTEDAKFPALVIGSGPTGLAVAKALNGLGIVPAVLDGGRRLASELAELARGVALGNGAIPAKLRRIEMGPDGPVKRKFGSNHTDEGADAVFEGGRRPPFLTAQASLAVGGLGAVWGAACLRARASDVDDWPFPVAALDPHYAAVERLMDVGPLDPRLGAVCADPAASRAPADDFVLRLARGGGAGVHVGAARLAVRDAACVRCGACMTGCAYGAIFDPETLIDAMRARGDILHFPGHLAVGLAETAAGARVLVARPDGTRAQMTARRVFVAAGALASTRLALAAFSPDERAILADSQHFVAGYAGARRISGDGRALARAFVEIEAGTASSRTVHVQFYADNPMTRAALDARLGALAVLGGPLAVRLSVAQGYLHSDASDRAELRLGPQGGLIAERLANPAAPAAVARALARLDRAAGRAGLRRLPGGGVSRFGAGNHCGASLAHARTPRGACSDLLGRVGGARHVHFVDASVLPSIPATTVTMTAMANARRIVHTAYAQVQS